MEEEKSTRFVASSRRMPVSTSRRWHSCTSLLSPHGKDSHGPRTPQSNEPEKPSQHISPSQHIFPVNMLGLKMKHAQRKSSSEFRAGGFADFFDRVKALQWQEEMDAYQCADYFSQSNDKRRLKYTVQQRRATLPMGTMTTRYICVGEEGEETSSPHDCSKDGPTDFCREQMCEWSYRIVDHFDLPREMVSFTMSYLDRFLSVAKCDRSAFKLAVITCLYTATKIHGISREVLPLNCLSELSRGEFDGSHIVEMEEKILHTLDWRMHPPTSANFVGTLCALIPSAIKRTPVSSVLFDRACFFTELAVCDYFFVTYKPSHVALAAVINAMEGFSMSDFPVEVRASFLRKMNKVLDASRNEDSVEAARDRLWQMYRRSEQFKMHDMAPQPTSQVTEAKVVVKDNAVGSESPTCISYQQLHHRKRFDTL